MLGMGTKPILILTLTIMLMALLGVNDAIGSNVFISSIISSINADARCEYVTVRHSV